MSVLSKDKFYVGDVVSVKGNRQWQTVKATVVKVLAGKKGVRTGYKIKLSTDEEVHKQTFGAENLRLFSIPHSRRAKNYQANFHGSEMVEGFEKVRFGKELRDKKPKLVAKYTKYLSDLKWYMKSNGMSGALEVLQTVPIDFRKSGPECGKHRCPGKFTLGTFWHDFSVEIYWDRETGKDCWTSTLAHELAHAYHFHIGFTREDVEQQYKLMLPKYENVKMHPGRECFPPVDGKSWSRRAYAATDHMEYFAETSAALLHGTTAYYPHNKEQLKDFDPGQHDLLWKLYTMSPSKIRCNHKKYVNPDFELHNGDQKYYAELMQS